MIACLLTNIAYGQGCSSTAEAAADIWHKYGDAARQIGCASAGAATAIASGGVALPAAVEQYGNCIRTTKKAQKMTEDMVEFYNQRLGKEGWGEIGPRSYEIGQEAEGTIISKGQRTFITPALGLDKTYLEIEKLAGRGKTDVTVCTWLPGEGGDRVNPREVWDLDIGAGKGTVGNQWDLDISGLEGRIMTILFTGQSAAKRMKYRISTEPYVTPESAALKNFTIEYGYDRAGSDYRNFNLDAPSPRECQTACAEDDQCKAFTYVPPGRQDDGARCWLKDEVAGRSEAPGLVSGVKGGTSQESDQNNLTEVAKKVGKAGMGGGAEADEAHTGWTAVWRPGQGAQRWRTNMSLEELETQDQQHFQNGLRLFDIALDGDAYGAVWRAGSGAQQWRAGISLETFQQLDAKYFDNGLRLTDVEVRDGEYTVVWRAGSGAQRWRAGMSKKEFASQDQTHFNNGLRLVDVEISDGEYTAVWRAGSGAQRWHANMSQDEFEAQAQTYFENGLRFVDVEIDGESYTGVWRAADGGQWWRTGMSTDQLGSRDEGYFEDGFRLMDVETPDP